MDRVQQITQEINKLLEEGQNLQLFLRKDEDRGRLAVEYESWYTRALLLITQVIPDRAQDFRDAYKLEKRREVSYDTYTTSDYLIGLQVTYRGSPEFDPDKAYSAKVVRQIAILAAAKDAAPAAIRNMQSFLKAELFDQDITGARELAKAGHLRSAGVICGVVLESHLKSVLNHRGKTLKKQHLTISDLNDALRGYEVYDIPVWRFIQRLGDIRNLCGHSGDREPTRDEVSDLVAGTEKIIKEVF